MELAATKAHEIDLITQREVMEMLGFEDREERYEFFKRYDVRSKYTTEGFEREGTPLEEMLARKADDRRLCNYSTTIPHRNWKVSKP